MDVRASLGNLDAPTKACSVCFRDLPETEFHLIRRGQAKRQTTCKRCINGYQKERRKAQRRRIPHTYASEVNRARQRRNRILALTERMCEQLGGVEGAAKEWVEAIQHARTEGKYHLVVRSLKALLELSRFCDETAPKIEDMDENEVNQLVQSDLLEIIRKEPMLALLAAERLEGWTVIPPPDIAAEYEELFDQGDDS